MSESDYIEQFLETNNKIQEEFLDFLDNEESSDENFKNLIKLFNDTKIRDCEHDIRLLLHMIVKVTNHHYRGPNFFTKIWRVLHIFRDDIKKYQNAKIFNIFKSNKRILLFLIEEKILTVDEYFVKQIIKDKYLNKKYPQYFAPEIKPFINEKWFPKNEWVEEIKEELPDNFFELRRIGENGNYICKLIREDLVEDFIAYVNKNCISRNATINQSLFETNSFLINKQSQLIEYAVFFGSIQIFTFLKNEKVELTSSLWPNAIHGKNAEIIHLLEENHVKLPATLLQNIQKDDEQSYREVFMESIKCNHNEIANYFLINYLQIEDKHSRDTIIQSLKYYNFSLLQTKHINKSSFGYLCYYDYYPLVSDLLKIQNIDINHIEIQNRILQ